VISLIGLTPSNSFLSVHHGKRQVPNVNPTIDYAFAFDIDGVLMLGSNALPAGVRALKLLHQRKIPYILLTNGGGKWEPDRAAELSDRLGVTVSH
jgi:ribonucleotide monophosphatase NagD (HAD superfamily)